LCQIKSSLVFGKNQALFFKNCNLVLGENQAWFKVKVTLLFEKIKAWFQNQFTIINGHQLLWPEDRPFKHKKTPQPGSVRGRVS
jgi:hypothetical protein